MTVARHSSFDPIATTLLVAQSLSTGRIMAATISATIAATTADHGRKRRAVEEDEYDRGFGGKRRNASDDDIEDEGTALEDFGHCVQELISTLHRNFLTVAANDDYQLSPISTITQRFRTVALSERIPWTVFWNDVYSSMCQITHFMDIPYDTDDEVETRLRLFCSKRLEAISNALQRRRNIQPLPTVSQLYANHRNRSYQQEAEDQNDDVYEKMWPQLCEIASVFIDVLWTTLDRHLRTIGSHFYELCDHLKLTYETAMLNGHIVLAAPLSQFAPLRTVKLMNQMQLRKFECYQQYRVASYGSVFDSTITSTIVASMQYAILLRGLRPVEMWPFNESKWPIHIRNHTALAAHYFLTGLTSETLLRVETDHCCYRFKYANEYARKLNTLIPYNDYIRAYDDYALSKYLDLIVHESLSENDTAEQLLEFDQINVLNLTDKHIKMYQCYSCHKYVICPISKINSRYRHEELTNELRAERPFDDAEAADDFRGPPFNDAEAERPFDDFRGQIQYNTISSSSSDHALSSRTECVLGQLLNIGRYALEDKFAMTDVKFINLLAIRTPCGNHDSMLSYQAFGLCSFPYVYDLGLHIDISRDLYVSHTTRLITQPLPSREVLYRAAGMFM